MGRIGIMSEKRFVMGGDTHIIDTKTNEEYYAPCETGLLDLLNSLHEENEQLKQKLENLDLNEKNDTVKMIDGKVFIKM